MLEVDRQAKVEAGGAARRSFVMISERGGLETARHLLHIPFA
jgi:hypothetical protein